MGKGKQIMVDQRIAALKNNITYKFSFWHQFSTDPSMHSISLSFITARSKMVQRRTVFRKQQGY